MKPNIMGVRQLRELLDRIDGAVRETGCGRVEQDGVGSDAATHGAHADLHARALQRHFDQLDAEHVASFVYSSMCSSVYSSSLEC